MSPFPCPFFVFRASHSPYRLASLLLLFCLLLMNGCGQRPALLPVSGERTPFFYDDSSRESLLLAIDQHLSYLQSRPHASKSAIGEKIYSSEELIESLTTFSDIFSSTVHPLKLDKRIREQFTIFQASGRDSSSREEMLVTGYYEPLLEGSLEQHGPFIHPLYAQPDSLIVHQTPHSRTREKGRLNKQGNFLPYWTRAEIESQDIAKGFELVYLKDPFDAFILHIQGSGKIKLRDGSLRSIHYATDNGRKYNSIGKLLVDEGRMALAKVTVPTIKQYLMEHPQELQRILHHNEKFIFFRWENDSGPFGSLGRPLTAGRSIAIDTSVLPMTGIGYLISHKPVVNAEGSVIGWKLLQRFVLPQDTGSAIKGPGRVDVFFGNGVHAKTAAGTMKEKGKLYFLIKK